MKILVTGVAGFIGMHVARRLLERGEEVIGVDNVNDYYDVNLKLARLDQLTPHGRFHFVKLDIADNESMSSLFSEHRFQRVVHLAAQAGVRYSLKNPHAYIRSNLTGFANILEGCRHHRVGHLVFASSSSVYGANTQMPFSEHHHTEHPITLYAATKKSNEMMAHAYSHLFNLPTTGLRFFTAYGPWGRPDMAPALFTKAILAGEPINVFNQGLLRRDFTYVDDIVESVTRIVDHVAHGSPNFDRSRPDPALSYAPYRIYNVGNHIPVELITFIETLEQSLGKKAVKIMLPMQDGDVPATYADVDDLHSVVGYAPSTPLAEGLAHHTRWYREYYGVPAQAE